MSAYEALGRAFCMVIVAAIAIALGNAFTGGGIAPEFPAGYLFGLFCGSFVSAWGRQ